MLLTKHHNKMKMNFARILKTLNIGLNSSKWRLIQRNLNISALVPNEHPWNYKIRRNINSGFFILIMRRVAIIFFWIENCKKIHAEILTVRHFMIISLFENRAWLQQFYISIGSFKWIVFYKKIFWNSSNIHKPYPLHSNTWI